MTAPAPVRDGGLLALAAFGLYTVLAQQTLYGDGAQFAVWSFEGQKLHPVHFLSLPLLNGWTAFWSWFGASFYAAACALSATGAAVGVWGAHLGCRALGWSRGDCVAVAVLVAVCPSVVFFATVLEVHGPFFAWAGVAFWLGARLLRRPTAVAGIGLGLVTGVAFAVHASAMILPLAFGTILLAEARSRGMPLRPLLRAWGLAGAVHAVLVAAAFPLFARLGAPDVDNAFRHVADKSQPEPFWELVAPTLWYEWGWAFFPISLLCFGGLASRRQRLVAAALLLAISPYLAVSLRIVRGIDEHGAYLIPLAIPAAWLTVRTFARPVSAVAVVLAAAAAFSTVSAHDRPGSSRAIAAGVDAVRAARPATVIIASQEELQALLAFSPDTRCIWLGSMFSAHSSVPALAGTLTAFVARESAAGRLVLLSAASDRVLADLVALGDPTATGLQGHFATAYRAEPVRSGAFAARLLRVR